MSQRNAPSAPRGKGAGARIRSTRSHWLAAALGAVTPHPSDLAQERTKGLGPEKALRCWQLEARLARVERHMFREYGQSLHHLLCSLAV